MREKVLVTGADGMLGASICRELLKQNYDVVAFILPNRKSMVLDNLAISLRYGNILNKADVLAAMEGCQFVIHAAASTALWPRKSANIMNINFQGTCNVSEVAELIGIERMVHIGTASSFGNGTLQNPGTEKSSYNSAHFQMDYMQSKYQAQNYLLDKFQKNDFPIVVINPTFMIGPFDSGPSSGRMLLTLYNGKLPAYSKGGKNFVYSLDVATAAVSALKKGKTGECYIAGNENMSYKDFFKLACSLRNQKFNLIKSPHFLSLGVGFISSILARIRNRPPGISYTIARLAAINQFYSSEKAVRELDMPQTPIKTAIKDCTIWYEENGYLQTSNK